MEKIQQMKDLLGQAESHLYAFKKKENIKASVRGRKVLMELRMLAHQLRMEILEEQKEIISVRFAKRKIKN